MSRYDRIPPELTSLDRWVCARDDSKVPMRAYENEAASSTNPNTWASFEEAVGSVNAGYYDHIGFVFNEDGIIGIDIDAGFDEEGFLSVLAADIIGKCKSYTEKSKSGRGFHILVKGTLPFRGKNNRNGVEIYATARFFIMTGDSLLYDTIIENQEAVDYIVEKYFQTEVKGDEGKTQTDRIYSPVWELPTDGRIKLRPTYPRIPDGCRNISLTSLAGMLHNQGYSKRQIYDELTHVNTVACNPPLPRSELQSIVNSVTRYRR